MGLFGLELDKILDTISLCRSGATAAGRYRLPNASIQGPIATLLMDRLRQGCRQPDFCAIAEQVQTLRAYQAWLLYRQLFQVGEVRSNSTELEPRRARCHLVANEKELKEINRLAEIAARLLDPIGENLRI